MYMRIYQCMQIVNQCKIYIWQYFISFKCINKKSSSVSYVHFTIWLYQVKSFEHAWAVAVKFIYVLQTQISVYRAFQTKNDIRLPKRYTYNIFCFQEVLSCLCHLPVSMASLCELTRSFVKAVRNFLIVSTSKYGWYVNCANFLKKKCSARFY